MNLQDASISRQLAILIQPVIAEDRRKFLADAEKARDMESFIKNLGNYKTI